MEGSTALNPPSLGTVENEVMWRRAAQKVHTRGWTAGSLGKVLACNHEKRVARTRL